MDGSRVALVVANDQYADPGLRRLVAPAQDAAALADVLADPAVGGFEVHVLRNESAQAIRLAVEDFFADRAPGDLLLLHFSCHGLKNAAGELFLAVADTKPTRLASTAVSADFVNRQMADSRAQRIALFLDCCYGGAFPRGMVVRAAGEAQVRDAFAEQEQVGGGRGRVVVTASSAMEYAFEGGHLASDAGKPAPSVFTSAVVDGLLSGDADRDGDGWVGLTELVGYVGDRVRRVTPNQTPQMWTFGAQGELLIARSRIRRITPTPLAPELLEAMESPLSATRFGIVDYLRERVHEGDLGQAFGAWQALHRLVDDDSRKVSDTARAAIAEAVPRATPESLNLTTASLAPATADLRLSGPPLAQTAVATTEAPWLQVSQQGPELHLIAIPPSPGDHEAALRLTAPTGERTIPVHLHVGQPEAEGQVAAASPVGRSMPEPQPLPEPVPEPEPRPVPEPEPPTLVGVGVENSATAPASDRTSQVATDQRVPWWVAGVLAVGALLLAGMNWPGAVESRKIWTDEDQTGWRVFRSWGDPLILGSFAALVAAVVARWTGRWAPLALGVVAGCAATVVGDGVLILGARIAGQEAGVWVAATVVGAAMVAVVVGTLRPRPWPVWPVGTAEALLVVAGGTLLLVSAAVRHDDGVSFFTVTPLAALEPFVIAALAWLALAATETRARMWLSATAATYALLGIVSAVPALADGAELAFLAALGGNLLVAIALAVAARKPLPTIERPTPTKRWLSQHPAVTAVVLGVGAVLLALANLSGLDLDLRLWYNSDFGSPDLYRHLADGTLTAAVITLLGAALAWRPGRLGQYAVGVSAGAAALFATAGVVILGGRIWYDDNVYVWTVSLSIAAVLLATVLAGAARSTECRRPSPVVGAVLAVGFVVLLIVQLVPDESGPSAVTYTRGLALLLPVAAAGLVLLASTAAEPVAVGAAAAYLVLFVMAAVYPISVDHAPVYFTTMLVGHAVLLTALGLSVKQRSA